LQKRLEELKLEARISPVPPADIERQLGYQPTEGEMEKLGYLAIAEFLDDDNHRVQYVRPPFQRVPDFGMTSVKHSFADLLERAEPPR